MPTITKLERQKHSKNRVSVFVDGEYSFSVFDEIAIEFDISVGRNASELNMEKILSFDEYKQALSKAFGHISRSEKSEKQLREFLLGKQFAPYTVEKVILRLKELDYIDDLFLAQNFLEHSKNLGKYAIKSKLKQKGISESIINQVLADFNEEDSFTSALEQAIKQKKKYEKYELLQQKKKVSDFLARRGFDWDTVSRVIEKIFVQDDM